MKKNIFFISALLLISNFAEAKIYKIKQGDTLTAIAHSNCIDTAQLRRTNNISIGEKLDIGRSITIPNESCGNNHNVFSFNFNKTNTEKKSYVADSLSYASVPFSASKFLGHRYVWGAVGPNTFDCSGFTSFIFKKQGVTLPRTAYAQFNSGEKVDRSDMKKGDLVFFDTEKHMTGKVNHVGMYIGNNQFIHASSAKHQVVIASLAGGFYSERFMGARRYTV
jgi:cell wall-associated NlpC family hydrolase